MAVIANIQVLLDDQTEGGVAKQLDVINAALIAAPGVLDSRVSDVAGPMIGRPDMETSVAVATGTYLTGNAFQNARFEIPLDRAYASRPLDTGSFSLRIAMPLDDGPVPSIDLNATISADGVAVDLVRVIDGKAICTVSSASAPFNVVSASMEASPQIDLPGHLDDVAFGSGRFKAVDVKSGRPILGPCLSVAAVGSYRHISLVDNKAVLHGISVFQVLDDRFVQSVAMAADSNSLQPLYFTDEGEIIGTDRIKLVPLDEGEGH